MRRPRFDEHDLTPAYIAIIVGLALIAAPRTVGWLMARAEAGTFANLTHEEDS